MVAQRRQDAKVSFLCALASLRDHFWSRTAALISDRNHSMINLIGALATNSAKSSGPRTVQPGDSEINAKARRRGDAKSKRKLLLCASALKYLSFLAGFNPRCRPRPPAFGRESSWRTPPRQICGHKRGASETSYRPSPRSQDSINFGK